MAMETSTGATQRLPVPPRHSASSASSPATVGALLTKAAGAGTAPRECRSPRSLLSRILGRGGGAGFGCRLRIPRYCSSGAGAGAREDAGEEVVEPMVVAGERAETEARESPRISLQGKKAAPEVSAASLGLGAGLVLLLSKGAAELSRMAELRAQMERLVMDARAAEARGGRSADDSASVVKERIVFADAGAEDAFSSNGSRTAAAAMDQMEAELEAELTRMQLASDYEGEDCATPQRDRRLESEAKSDVSSESGDPVVDYAAGECKDEDGTDADEEEDEADEDEEESMPCHGGVPARVLERRLHELLQSRHEERIAELETELERAQRKLQEKEREVSRWRDTAKLASRHKDESRLR